MLGFIDKNNENDLKLAHELIATLEGKLSKRNLLVLLCQIEKIHLSWMS